MASSSTSGVPPGFRFHPTEEELILYYLKKKVALERFDLEVIREVDLNKVEPWELQEKCAIGSGLENEWYFFSRRDRKYPNGLRMNRATAAGFWKATGRDKCLGSVEKIMGLRKTLVFYRGRAPHGQKTHWIMHEYRLYGDNAEDGWVVCCVFKKKALSKDVLMNNSNGYIPQEISITDTTSYTHGLSVHPHANSSLSASGNFCVQDGSARHLPPAGRMVDQMHRHLPREPELWGWGKGSSLKFIINR